MILKEIYAVLKEIEDQYDLITTHEDKDAE